MKTLEIPEGKWGQFCAQLQESARGAMATIQVLQPDGITTPIVTRIPLASFSLDPGSDGCNTNLLVEVGNPGEKPASHLIIEPIHIRLKGDHHNDRYHRLEISAENGTTIIDLHPGFSPEFLNALKVEKIAT